MKKVTKGMLTTGLAALAIGACGDTVEVEVPPPEIPPIVFPPPVIPVPPVPPVIPPPVNQAPAPQGTIPAHTVVVGGTTTQDVAGYFRDADGDALTYTASSSNDAVATVAIEGTVATVTGVAVGNGVVTVTASDPDGASAAQAFGVEVESEDEGVKAATVAIFGLRSVTDRNVSINPTDVSGDISVMLDVQPNDETIVGIALTLGEAVLHCRGTSTDQSGVDQLASAGGQIEVDCFFNTDAVVGECMGAQLEPMFANGDHDLGARITTAEGTTREALVTQPITLKNSGYVMVEHSPGTASAVTSGVTYYGGPVGEDETNVNSFHACPVSFKGTTVGELSLTPKLTGPGATELEVGEDDDAPPTLVIAQEMDAFTWTVNMAKSGGVENRPEMDEHWIINDGDIKDGDGLLVTDEFRHDTDDDGTADEAMAGPLYFDFKAPTWTHDEDEGTPQEILVKTSATSAAAPIAATHYSAGALSVRGLTDGGVGMAMAAIAVGDCAVEANNDSTKTTDFMPLSGMENVGSMAALPEDDFTPELAGADAGGVDCYVAEATAIHDGLMNAATLPGVPIGSRAYFGVDKGKPVVSDVEPDVSGIVLMKGEALSFDAEDPDLATGEDGSGVSRYLWKVGRGQYAAGGSSFGTAGLRTDGSYSITALVQDGASPRNSTAVPFSVTVDSKVPTFSISKSQSDIGNTSATTVTVSVGGTISDANGVETAELSLRSRGTTCAAGEDLAVTRVAGNKRDVADGSKSVTFDEAFTVKAPGAGVAVPEQLCFYLSVEDVATGSDGKGAGNGAEYELGSFQIGWKDPGPVYNIEAFPATADETNPTTDPATIAAGAEAFTAKDPAEATEGVEATSTDPAPTVFAIQLSAAPTADVTVALSAPPAVTLAPASVTIAAGGTVSTAITMTAEHDRNTASESVNITATATSGDDNYDGTSVTIPAMTVDDDFTLSVTPGTVAENDALTEDVPTLVTITVTPPLPVADPLTEIALGTGSTGLEFRAYVKDAEYDPTAAAITGAAPVAATNGKSASVSVWLLVANDTDVGDPDNPETILIGTAPDNEEGRMEPVMITVTDADPEVTLSVTPGEVNEGDEDVTLTITATASAPMDGIFEFPLSELQVTDSSPTAGVTLGGLTGTLVIDNNATTGTATFTATVAEDDDDTNDHEVTIGRSDGTVTVGTLTVTVGRAELTVVDNDEEDDGN